MRRTAAPGQKTVGRVIIGAFAVAIFIKFFLLDFMVADGHSMAPAIKPGTILFVSRLFYGVRLPWSGNYILQWRSVQEGDVVVFYTPHGDIAVKRCMEILPGGTFIAIGDNSIQSYDSRNYGPIPRNNIIGRVLRVR
ncbi:MAG: S26 family signal peptidase [Treponema sp.]|nr:S26 family signal peptidase [Treponema sp.]